LFVYWSPELSGVVIGGVLTALTNVGGKVAHYLIRTRGDRRPVERDAVR
jgi:hypothetical protein